MIYETQLAGHRLRYSFQETKTQLYFGSWLRPSFSREFDIELDSDTISRMLELNNETGGRSYAEYKALIAPTAKALLKNDGCIFHAVSFHWKGKAFLLTGPSGTGKSTQYFNWQRLFPREIMMISGDMPVIKQREDKLIWVCPSPWNGKERIGNRIRAPLGGIILLEQGAENRIERLPAREAIAPFLWQFPMRPETEAQICALARLLDQMLRDVPCFKLINRGDDASTLLLRETIAVL